MAKRSRVELYEQIRKVREREGVSKRELARRFHVHRRDVRQALDSAVPPPRKKPPRKASVLDPWKPLIDSWLEADKSAPRKQRHTARRVWQRLVEEHGVVVGESTVRRYVGEVRRRMEVPAAEVMVPQRHLLGDEAEVDFGTITAEIAGLLCEVQLFLMRLSASGRSYVRAYLNECQEVFLDGHVRAFDHFGGVPARIRYDNLKAAVVRVLKGRDRIESERFVAMRSHYGFDSFFCQPGIKGAHEKGVWRERSGASGGATWCRCRRWRASRSSTSSSPEPPSETTPGASVPAPSPSGSTSPSKPRRSGCCRRRPSRSRR